MASPSPSPVAGPSAQPDKSVDDLLAEMNRIPLFMTSLDESDGKGGSNEQLEALKALQYEGTKHEVADSFRDQGNQCARAQRWQDARDFYTQALDVLSGKAAKADGPTKDEETDPLKRKLQGEVGERDVDWLDNTAEESDDRRLVDLDEEERKEKLCEELSFVNRALCNLKLKNYGMAVKDCSRTLSLNAKNEKALYRTAQALHALDKNRPAQNAIDIGERLAKARGDRDSEASFTALGKQVADRIRYMERVERERKEREEAKQEEARALKLALAQRRIVAKQTVNDTPDLEDAKVTLEEPKDPSSFLTYPVLLLYPTASQSELVKAVSESATMQDILATTLPAPFDVEQELGGPNDNRVNCYVETSKCGLRKVGKNRTWLDITADGGAVLKDGLFSVNIVPKAKETQWIADWKKQNNR